MTHSIETQSSIPEEWLSGYLDGELSDDERAQVTVALEESESLRVKLDELRGVSELLKSLPQPSLGADFAAKLPLEPGVRRSAGLPWRFGMTAGSLVAASLVAGVLWIQSGQMQSPIEMASSEAAPELRKSADSALLADRGAEALVLNSPEAVGADAASVARIAAAPRASGRSLAMGAGAASDEFDSDVAAAFITRPNVTAALPRAGDLVPLLESNGSEVTVVEWAVLDVQEAFGQLQVTLSNMGVASSEEVETTYDGDGELLAVFVEADETVMQAVIAQTRSQLTRAPAARMAIADPVLPAPAVPAVVATSKPSAIGEALGLETAEQGSGFGSATGSPVVQQMRKRQAEERADVADDQATTMFATQPFGSAVTASKEGGASDSDGRLQYQVPLQLSQTSVDKIVTNNFAYQAREPKRLLIVLKAAE